MFNGLGGPEWKGPCNTRVTGKSMIFCGRQVPPGWTKIAPQTEKPLGSWACTLVLPLLCTYGQCNIAMCFSYFWCSSFHGKHKLTQMDHFVRRYKQYSDRQKNMGETERKLYVSSGEETKPTTATRSGCKTCYSHAIPTSPSSFPTCHKHALDPCRIGLKRVILLSSGWVASISQRVCWALWCRLQSRAKFSNPISESINLYWWFPSARLPVAVVDGLLTNPPSTPRQSGLLPHLFSPHVGYMIHALNAMVPWWLKVTSYTERNHVPERLMDGTYVEGLCAYQARIETTSNL